MELFAKTSQILSDDLSLNSWVCDYYEISQVEKGGIESAIKEVFQSLKALETKACRVAVEGNGNSYLEIDSLKAHQTPLLDQLRHRFGVFSSPEKSEELANIIFNERFFSESRFLRRIAFEDQSDDPDLPVSHHIIVEWLLESGEKVGEFSYLGGEPFFHERYGHLADFDALSAQIVTRK
ncbi:MAG TPA: hypothetical protein VMN36_01980 [Verrucomicrobiales bacterium]|nr:hypothetical protein [Verrucomicrobiales bacterium]